ncbi:MAG: hypothetical protein F9K24_13690 [Leptonema illini]|uniref:Uncharacterized protein n=1 Tax=Leptonema illini TaxID=183 RepID=A0A833GZT3_9LEPT|nr:MAG: hypothetical protein F9K24_13690 [Leptonema illini]
MDDVTKGAWVFHHSQKIADFRNGANQFPNIDFAGKCGQLISAASQDGQSQISQDQFAAYARGCGINVRTEMPALIQELERQKIIERVGATIELLGMTSKSILIHTARIFDEASPAPKETASIATAETISVIPKRLSETIDEVADVIRLPSSQTASLIKECSEFGLIDSTSYTASDPILFNGNLFRSENETKLSAVINSLTSRDMSKVNELDQVLRQRGAVPADIVKRVLGEDLFAKLHSIGFYDVSTIVNNQGDFAYVTRPSAFKKFGNSFLEDSLDLAKAFVASLTYGMQKSERSRGRIQMIGALMSKLIQGRSVGPATAIGEDYKILEVKGVVELTYAQGGQYYMRLKKREVGELALSVINSGDASLEAVVLPRTSATSFTNPERSRSAQRKKENPALEREVAAILNDLRTGVKL